MRDKLQRKLYRWGRPLNTAGRHHNTERRDVESYTAEECFQEFSTAVVGPLPQTVRTRKYVQKACRVAPSNCLFAWHETPCSYPPPPPFSPTFPKRTTQGFHFFWACCANLVGAAFLRLLLSAPRPFMYDQRLRPLTDRYETSHGLPSLETHMATVVAGWWAESGGGQGNIDDVRPLVRLLAVGYICFVGFTRFEVTVVRRGAAPKFRAINTWNSILFCSALEVRR